MIVAAATFGEDISLRLDSCDGFIVIEANTHANEGRNVEIRDNTRMARLAQILELRIDVLLVGGIRRCDYYFLMHSGVQVVPNLSGRAKKCLSEFQRKRDVSDVPRKEGYKKLRLRLRQGWKKTKKG